MGREDFTPDEWRTLQFAPFWTFSAVVGASRDFDPSEYEAFARSLDRTASTGGGLAREVVASVDMDRDRLTTAFALDGRPIAAGLWAVAALLTRVPPDEAESFKDVVVYGIGEDIARARGRFGRVVSEDDAKALALVEQILA